MNIVYNIYTMKPMFNMLIKNKNHHTDVRQWFIIQLVLKPTY